MSNVSGTDPSRVNYDRLRHDQDQSVDQVVNGARRQAGLKSEVRLRGDDTTTSKLKEEERAELVAEFGSKKGAAMTALHAVGEAYAAATEGSLAEPAMGIVTIFELGKGYASDIQLAEKLKAAGETDQMHLAVLGALSAPSQFKAEASEPYASTKPGFQSGFMKVSTALDLHPEEKAVLQLHADRGSTAALDLAKTGELGGQKSMDAVLAKHPDLQKKYAEDPAFRAGFQLVAWSQDHGRLSDVATSVLDRDARYNAANIQYRG